MSLKVIPDAAFNHYSLLITHYFKTRINGLDQANPRYIGVTELLNLLKPDICIMSLSKSFQFIGTLVGVLSPALVTFASLPPQLPDQSESKWEVSLKFPDETRERERISSSGGGGSRSINEVVSCVEAGETPLKTSLKAVMPTTDLSRTIADNPSLFVYVPKTTAEFATFIVRDKNGEEVYRSEFLPPENCWYS